LIDDYEKLPAFLESLGFQKLHVQLSADLAGEQLFEFQRQRPGEFSKDELIELFGKIKLMKRAAISRSSTRRNR
jgi:hypothetical protein